MKIINKLLGLCILLVLFNGCKKEPNLTVMEEVAFTSELTSSVDHVALSEDNASSSVIDFTWSQVTYPVDAPVTYSIQIDVPEDTIGTSGWANAINIEVGEDVITKSMLGEELNTIALDLGLKDGESGVLVVRANSFLDRFSYSKPLTINVTPYKVFTGFPSLYVPGDYQGYDPAAAPRIVSVNSNDLYEGYIYIPAGGTNQFKLTAQPAWEPMAYGDGGNGVLIEANYAGGNFTAPSDGYYNLTADLNTMSYTVTKTTWSIIGDATPGGWDSDTQMTYDPVKKVWEVTADMLSAGSFKFRANNAWVIDFGVNNDNKLVYADHPVLGYTPDLNNLTVPSAGNYTITLDLQDAGNYKFVLKKN